MKLFKAYSLLIFLSFTAKPTSAQIYAKAGCNGVCGQVMIPYPFGIGPNCSVNEWYAVDCKSSRPYLSALNLEIREINVDNQTVTVNVSMISDYRDVFHIRKDKIVSVDLGTSPFLFSRLSNQFVVGGCGNAVILDHGGVITGCSTICHNHTIEDKCQHCQTTIPHYLKSYTIDLTGLERISGDGSCRYGYLADSSSGLFGGYWGYSEFPISLVWTLSDRDYRNLSCCSAWHRLKFYLHDGTSVDSWKCDYPSFNATPYLLDGCMNTEECSSCRGDGDVCNYGEIYDDDDVLRSWNFTCSTKERDISSKNVTLGKNRPTMKAVAMELETIRTSHVPSMVQTNIGELVYREALSMETYGESSSTFMSFDDNNASQ